MKLLEIIIGIKKEINAHMKSKFEFYLYMT